MRGLMGLCSETNGVLTPPAESPEAAGGLSITDAANARRFWKQLEQRPVFPARPQMDRTRMQCDAAVADHSVEWATRELDAGIALLARKKRDRRANLNGALDCLSRALTVFTPKSHRLEYGRAQARLGEANAALGALDQNAGDHWAAIDAFTEALTVIRPGTEPFDWADIHFQLGRAWLALPKDTRSYVDPIQTAIPHLSAALMVYGTEDESVDKADVLVSLGAAWRRASPSPGVNIEIAKQCLEDALNAYSCEEHPARYAIAQCELGHAWRELQTGDRAFNALQAVGCFREAIEFTDEKKDPELWRMVQFALGGALLDLDAGLASQKIPVEDQADTLDEAADALEAALDLTPRSDRRLDWAAGNRMLGRCLARLATVRTDEQRAAHAQAAATACFSDALEIYTADRYPVEHAQVQGELGYAHMLPREPSRGPAVPEALRCFEAALALWEKQNDAVAWSRAALQFAEVLAALGDDPMRANLLGLHHLCDVLKNIPSMSRALDEAALAVIGLELRLSRISAMPESA